MKKEKEADFYYNFRRLLRKRRLPYLVRTLAYLIPYGLARRNYVCSVLPLPTKLRFAGSPKFMRASLRKLIKNQRTYATPYILVYHRVKREKAVLYHRTHKNLFYALFYCK